MKGIAAIAGCLFALAVYAATQSQYFSGDVVVKGQLKDYGGTNYLKDAPLGATNWVRNNGAWVPLPAAASGISEAPMDSTAYIRLDGDWHAGGLFFSTTDHGHVWSDISDPPDFSTNGHSHAWPDITGKPDVSTNGHTHAASDVVSGTMAAARLGSGTPSSSVFLRGDGTWATPPTGAPGTNGIPDAPNDGVFYGRQSTSWVQPTVSDVGGLQGELDAKVAYNDLSDLTVGNLTVTGDTTLSGLGSDLTSGTGYKFLVHNSSGNLLKKVSTSFALSYLGAAAASHSHGISDVTGLQTSLDSKATNGHVHAIADTTGLQAALDSKATNGHTHPDLANFVFVTVASVTNSNQDTTYRSVLGTVKSGYSATLASNTLSSGTVVKIEAAGTFNGDDGMTPDVELRIGSSFLLHFDMTEPQSTGPDFGTPWNLTAWVTVTTAGGSAVVNATAWMDYHDNTGGYPGSYAASPVIRTRGNVSGTLSTTVNNAVDLVYRGNDANANEFACSHFILQQF